MTEKLTGLPNLICPGAQKAGTTTLFSVLVQHPEIVKNDIKEVQFFDKYWHRGVKWYHKTTSVDGDYSYLMDFTPGYMSSETYIRRMKEVLPDDVKFLIILRNPVDRMYSHYLMNLHTGLEQETDAMKAFENSRHRYQNGEEVPGYFSKSMYADKIRLFYELFRKENIKIVIFEDFISDIRSETASILGFLELEVSEDINYDIWRNNSISGYSPPLIRAIRKIVNPELLRKILPYTFFKKIRRWVNAVNKTNHRAEKDLSICPMLMQLFEDDISELEKLTGLNVGRWKKKYPVRQDDYN